jgi:hypothetical protein
MVRKTSSDLYFFYSFRFLQIFKVLFFPPLIALDLIQSIKQSSGFEYKTILSQYLQFISVSYRAKLCYFYYLFYIMLGIDIYYSITIPAWFIPRNSFTLSNSQVWEIFFIYFVRCCQQKIDDNIQYYVVKMFGRLAVECLCFQKAKIINNGIMAEKTLKSRYRGNNTTNHKWFEK